RIVDRRVLHLIKMWLECPVEETDDRGRKIRLADGAYLEVVRPSAQRAVHLAHQLCGFLPCPRSVRQCMDLLNHALDALLRWPVTQACLAESGGRGRLLEVMLGGERSNISNQKA